MACVYYYKGKLIGDELQLNDFLIERRKFHSKYGDVVFKRTNKANEVIEVVDGKADNKLPTMHTPRPTNCKNCGAVLTSYKCEYCGTEY